MKKRKQRGSLWPQLTPKKLLSLLGALVLGVFYTFFSPTGSALYGTVTRVVDGDTIHVTIGGEDRTVRLIGVDTPETVHPQKTPQFYGKEASDFTKRSLLNQTVWLEYDASPKDRYNRHLAYVWLAEPGAGEDTIRRDMFNARLILDGYGKVMTIQPNSKYADVFTRFQQEARGAKKGLWGKR
ncbi:MAG: thermonuclease family protein [Synergistaceae bacterium]|jgi:micrococcal nuclease|nr:thermonuclease family protein [Synergistaceae bacterium]